MVNPQDVLHFWFDESQPSDWFAQSDAYDLKIKDRFLDTVNAARLGQLAAWRDTPEGRLAEIIVLDQFPRNLFRDSGEQFAGDALALSLAQEAVAAQLDLQLKPEYRIFLYMPYMHSESAAVHLQAVELFEKLGFENQISYEYRHKAVIDHFGRYPHRNALLNRESTPEEAEFLKMGNRF